MSREAVKICANTIDHKESKKLFQSGAVEHAKQTTGKVNSVLKKEIIIFLILIICPFVVKAQANELDNKNNPPPAQTNNKPEVNKQENQPEPVNSAATNNQSSCTAPQNAQREAPSTSIINTGKDTNNTNDSKQNLQIKHSREQLNLDNKRLLISNFAQTRQALVVETTYNISAETDLHKVQMRLNGSMCLVCLKTLQEKVGKIFGVDSVTISNPQQSAYRPYSPDFSKWVEAIIIYDRARVTLADLKAYFNSQGYLPYKVVDK